MLHEERKISKIVEELTVYFLAIGADDVSSEIKIGDGQATIFFRANYRPEYQERLEDVEKYLNLTVLASVPERGGKSKKGKKDKKKGSEKEKSGGKSPGRSRKKQGKGEK